jgi:hypothetical protein
LVSALSMASRAGYVGIAVLGGVLVEQGGGGEE